MRGSPNLIDQMWYQPLCSVPGQRRQVASTLGILAKEVEEKE